MEKYESLIAAVVFEYSGTYAYNRQQLCDFTTKDLNSEFCLQIGETFKHGGHEYEIKNIRFSIEQEWWFPKQTKLDVFSKYDNNPVNCKIYVLIEKV